MVARLSGGFGWRATKVDPTVALRCE